ncbi:MAG: hypothetical protein IKM77_10840 [Prevotella sp.]|nr:hypothetical protein [Prevotella sp.]
MYKRYQPQQPNGGGGRGFRSEESMSKAFSHSCLGRMIILACISLILMIVAYISAPTEAEMQREMEDNMIQCMEAHGNAGGDVIDDFIHNFTYTLTIGDSTQIDPEIWAAYHKYNRLESGRHNFYSTTYLFNNIHPEGIRVGIGFFFVVIPTVKYSDILLDIAPIRKSYDQKLIVQPDSASEGFTIPEAPKETDLSGVKVKGYDYDEDEEEEE